MNWRGRPLTRHEVVVNLIAATTTRTGLKLHAELDSGNYPKGLAVTDHEMCGIDLRPHAFYGAWNYTIMPNAGPKPIARSIRRVAPWILGRRIR